MKFGFEHPSQNLQPELINIAQQYTITKKAM